MKLVNIMILGFILNSVSFATEKKEYSTKFCEAKDEIADFYHIGTFGLTNEEYRTFKITSDKVDRKINELCDSKKDPNTILEALRDVCNEQVQKNSTFSEKLLKYSSESPCDKYYSQTILWHKGFSYGLKSKDETKCEDQNSISNLGRGVKEITDNIDPNKAPKSIVAPK